MQSRLALSLARAQLEATPDAPPSSVLQCQEQWRAILEKGQACEQSLEQFAELTGTSSRVDLRELTAEAGNRLLGEVVQFAAATISPNVPLELDRTRFALAVCKSPSRYRDEDWSEFSCDPVGLWRMITDRLDPMTAERLACAQTAERVVRNFALRKSREVPRARHGGSILTMGLWGWNDYELDYDRVRAHLSMLADLSTIARRDGHGLGACEYGAWLQQGSRKRYCSRQRFSILGGLGHVTLFKKHISWELAPALSESLELFLAEFGVFEPSRT